MPIGRRPTLLHYVLHALLLGRGAAFHTTDDALYATTQVAKLEAGRIALPPSANVTELLVEIGCSDLMTLDHDHLPRAPTAFLIAFEPMLDKYAVLLARGSQRMYVNKRNQPNGMAEVQNS